VLYPKEVEQSQQLSNSKTIDSLNI